MKKHRLALFASGKGSNAIRMMDYFYNHSFVEISELVSNSKECGALKLAEELGVSCKIFSNNTISQGDQLLSYLKEKKIDYIILVGFLRKIPPIIIDSFENKIINLHPSLLPKYGGKGMFGDNVHKAVLENKEKETGITIHLVDSDFDKGHRIAQFFTKIDTSDKLDDIKIKIKKLEHNFLPCTVEQFIINAN